jgi:hypothetical protein
MKFFILLLISIFILSCSDINLSNSRPYVIQEDYGGNVLVYERKLAKLKENHREVKIVGTCVSACTLYLQIACVKTNSKIGFHGVSSYGHYVTDTNRMSTKLIADSYPPKLKEWFLKNAAHLYGKDVKYLTGAAVIRMGVKECQDMN